MMLYQSTVARYENEDLLKTSVLREIEEFSNLPAELPVLKTQSGYFLWELFTVEKKSAAINCL